MKQTFCDHCDKKLGNSVGQARLIDDASLRGVGDLKVEISIVKFDKKKDMKIGEPDLCRDCILHAVKQLDSSEGDGK